MKFSQVMKALKATGTAQNRKIYARHGVVDPMFGVSTADLDKLRKDILRQPGSRRYAKHDHELALELWSSGYYDARLLATKIADPQQMKSAQLDQWIRSCTDRATEGAVVGLTAKTKFGEAKMKKWRQSKNELTAAAGWNLLAGLALEDNERPDSFFAPYLPEIRDTIHGSENRARYAMNNALIAIGGRSTPLHKKAGAAAKKIGPVHVDHGDTGCRTPDAIPYMERMWARKQKKSA